MSSAVWAEIKDLTRAYIKGQGRRFYYAPVVVAVLFAVIIKFMYDTWDDVSSKMFSMVIVLLMFYVMFSVRAFFIRVETQNTLHKYYGILLASAVHYTVWIVVYLITALLCTAFMGTVSYGLDIPTIMTDIAEHFTIQNILLYLYIDVAIIFAFISNDTPLLRKFISLAVIVLSFMLYFLIYTYMLDFGETIALLCVAAYVLIMSAILFVQGYNNLKHLEE